jgi:hypothetical protein
VGRLRLARLPHARSARWSADAGGGLRRRCTSDALTASRRPPSRPDDLDVTVPVCDDLPMAGRGGGSGAGVCVVRAEVDGAVPESRR